MMERQILTHLCIAALAALLLGSFALSGCGRSGSGAAGNVGDAPIFETGTVDATARDQGLTPFGDRTPRRARAPG